MSVTRNTARASFLDHTYTGDGSAAALARRGQQFCECPGPLVDWDAELTTCALCGKTVTGRRIAPGPSAQ